MVISAAVNVVVIEFLAPITKQYKKARATLNKRRGPDRQ